jgi:hypothetical protein
MSELTKLNLFASDGQPLVHKLYRQEESAQGLLVTLPGNHYGVDGPLLYYPSEFLSALGWDTLGITYGYQSRGIDFSPELVPDLLQECHSALDTVLRQREYAQVALLGKSLGTMIIAQICSTYPGLNSALVVFLTPPIGMPFFDQPVSQSTQATYLAMGTADRFFSEEALENLSSRQGVKATLIEGADHSLNVEGDLEATMQGLKRVVGEVVDFVQSGGAL